MGQRNMGELIYNPHSPSNAYIVAAVLDCRKALSPQVDNFLFSFYTKKYCFLQLLFITRQIYAQLCAGWISFLSTYNCQLQTYYWYHNTWTVWIQSTNTTKKIHTISRSLWDSTGGDQTTCTVMACSITYGKHWELWWIKPLAGRIWDWKQNWRNMSKCQWTTEFLHDHTAKQKLKSWTTYMYIHVDTVSCQMLITASLQ